MFGRLLRVIPLGQEIAAVLAWWCRPPDVRRRLTLDGLLPLGFVAKMLTTLTALYATLKYLHVPAATVTLLATTVGVAGGVYVLGSNGYGPIRIRGTRVRSQRRQEGDTALPI